MDAHDQLEQLERHFGRPLTKCERVLTESAFAVHILANPTTGDVQFVDPSALPLPTQIAEVYRRRGLEYVGVIGVSLDLVPTGALDATVGEHTMSAISKAFLGLMERVIARVEESMNGDVQWLFNLWSLEDTRN